MCIQTVDMSELPVAKFTFNNFVDLDYLQNLLRTLVLFIYVVLDICRVVGLITASRTFVHGILYI